MYAHNAAPWSGHFHDDVRDTNTPMWTVSLSDTCVFLACHRVWQGGGVWQGGALLFNWQWWNHSCPILMTYLFKIAIWSHSISERLPLFSIDNTIRCRPFTCVRTHTHTLPCPQNLWKGIKISMFYESPRPILFSYSRLLKSQSLLENTGRPGLHPKWHSIP